MRKVNFLNLIYGFGEFVGWIIGALLMIVEGIDKGLSLGLITNDLAFQIGLILFLIACAWAVVKANKKAREAEDKLKLENNRRKSSPAQSFEVKSENQQDGITAGYIRNVNYPDTKKKENLNMLARLIQELTDDIGSYCALKDRQKSVKERANAFFEFSQSHIAEMSPELNKLIFNKLFPAIKQSIFEVDYFWQVMEKREEVRLSGKIPAIFDSSRMTDTIEKMFEIEERVYTEINKVLSS